jgi:hypothetical protein
MGRKEESYDVTNVFSERGISNDGKSVLVIFVSSLSNGWILDLAYTFHIYPNKSYYL